MAVASYLEENNRHNQVVRRLLDSSSEISVILETAKAQSLFVTSLTKSPFKRGWYSLFIQNWGIVGEVVVW